ncbi:alanyl-tRNA editing protein [Halorubrum ezzemoulense]|uniref:alanyl-tRNA editing protein n=1 Tax=Halorubrum ezzemoulense TaxID=337243 RepID=UPI00232C00DE|nr:alanine--tRNA ligase-related protein [Halorubrum ezzemoulense]MDB2281149.1 alanine--tRNA ligase-related protein [Halorubrum ezzemoulense]MDB9251754.1 alanine--tRNA ligase-related protein [Halorubrum ezzemoulense]MDB9256163.1 alanine--tRNA ligase-related protein [Halorubrum ezzemoulense]MDB9276874.1 alanine--tRNA ligase-related protein [Halorubrum ezzemoulense]
MTASRAPAEPAVREFEATVDRVDGREVVLDETYFYAESGGQPADRGTLDGHLVDDVTERGGDVVHALDSDADPDLAPGDEVTGLVDDAFRTYCARAHTASHVLYGAARRIAEDLGYAGFDISETKVRVDLTTAEPLDDGDLIELERLANRAVWDSLPVSWATHSAEAARDVDGIAFNTKTEEGAMSGGAVRVVTVGDADDPWDVAACGGTHVENTAEIGPIAVLDRSNPGEGVTRVEFAVGPTAIDELGAVHAAALDAATTLDARVGDLPDAVDRLRGEADRLEADLREARGDLLAARLRDLPTTEVDGARWAVGTVDDADPNELREPATALVGGGADADDGPDALAAIGAGDAPFVVVAAAEDTAVDAGDIVGAITAEFGGGGGGGPTFAQGGGLDADPAAVAAWFRKR